MFLNQFLVVKKMFEYSGGLVHLKSSTNDLNHNLDTPNSKLWKEDALTLSLSPWMWKMTIKKP